MNGSCCAYRGKCIFLTIGKDTKYKICIYWDYVAITKTLKFIKKETISYHPKNKAKEYK